jgi:hypothetical protein
MSGLHTWPRRSRISLHSWFYAIFPFVTTRHGVNGKELHGHKA